MAFHISSLLGPNGGLVSAGFGAGCIAGYSFAIRTAYRSIKTRLDKQETDCTDRMDRMERDYKAQIAGLKNDMDEHKRDAKSAREELIRGLYSQLAQVRESAERQTGLIDERGRFWRIDEKGRLWPPDE